MVLATLHGGPLDKTKVPVSGIFYLDEDGDGDVYEWRRDERGRVTGHWVDPSVCPTCGKPRDA